MQIPIDEQMTCGRRNTHKQAIAHENKRDHGCRRQSLIPDTGLRSDEALDAARLTPTSDPHLFAPDSVR